MNIVIPMAGRGLRFQNAGISMPKPLIQVRGLPLEQAKNLIFVCLKEHLECHSLERDIRGRFPGSATKIVALDDVTEGQACTALRAEEWIDTTEPSIFNADSYLRTNLMKAVRDAPNCSLISVFLAPGEQWSFARADKDGRVIETAEKRRISDWACTGLYYFAQGNYFVKHARSAVAGNDRTAGEFYVAPIFNRLIAEGLEVRMFDDHSVSILGTPEELRRFIEEPDRGAN